MLKSYTIVSISLLLMIAGGCKDSKKAEQPTEQNQPTEQTTEKNPQEQQKFEKPIVSGKKPVSTVLIPNASARWIWSS